MKTISFHVFIFSPQLLFRAHYSTCTLKSPYKCLPSRTDGIAAPSIWFSANAHTDKKSLKMKNEESTYQKLQLACIPCAFPLFRTVLALGGISKMGLLKPQIRMGSFEIPHLQNFITWHNEILFIHSFLWSIYQEAGTSVLVETCMVTSDRDLTQARLSKRRDYSKG